MKTKSVKIVFWGIFLILSLGIGAGLMAEVWIKGNIFSLTKESQRTFPQADEVTSLLAYLQSDESDWSKKNRILWALGELEDTRALAPLEALYSGKECDHDHGVCQYELSKAVKKIKGLRRPAFLSKSQRPYR